MAPMCLGPHLRLAFPQRRSTAAEPRDGRPEPTVKPRLIAHLADEKRQPERDLSDGVGRVVPAALDRKYPNAGTDWVDLHA
jgi:hypothetical protein